MKIGLSSYSLSQAMNAGEMSILDAIQWVADQGGEHIEIVPMGELDLIKKPELIEQIKDKANDVGIDISHYLIGANFITESREEFEAEVARVKQHVEIAHQLGVKLMRHDVAWRSGDDATIVQFEKDLPVLVEACQTIADYAKQFDITTSIENHGLYVQASDRVQRLIHEVNRDNFKTTVDVGNFMCVDENSVAAVKKNLPLASFVHFKDFYWRPSYQNPGDGWFQTINGNFLRGAIVGHGDIDMREVAKIIKESGYDGYISVEFEGMEDCRKGSKIGMDNVRRFLEEA
ncbi:sugar phosphate isomerase/epimerase family protein [Lederbergia galactosidilytica]|uniref:Sugar phosphate isomerase n=1 Tax=Lederbergia galactosidilytica TaxID=217031 RepID=A0A178A6L6_9BACI|nr:sugar phosphate isomerase/epimerase family protein [Lederbergia galactosidilytica]KRG15425.1 sugar phosphate isomerase [Virgibacillus soli]MBP1916204.1 sugar phosphate isomerase/epimerase [Lederbergia galactosidilytica]OAK75837.1 sugar phosphate isomerase [Lederbergia galactosidilytica]